jgi:hypothetical protein
MSPRKILSQSPSKLPAYILFFFISLYILTAQGSIQTSDGRIMYLLTQSMVERQKVSFFENYLISSKVSVTKGSKEQYSKYGLGLSLMAVPFYLVGKALSALLNIPADFATMFCVSLINPTITAVTCMMLYLFALRRLKFSHQVATVLALAYGLTTMAWAQSEDFMSDPATGFLLLCASYFITDTSKSIRSIILAGLLLGMAVFVRLTSVIAIPLYLVYLGLEWKESASKNIKGLVLSLVRFVAPIAMFIFVIFIYNYVRFHNIFESGYDNDFRPDIFTGLYGLLFSPGKSVFLYNPIVLIGLLGFRRLFKNHFNTAILFCLIALTQLCFYSAWGSWHGGNSWGPRFLLVVLPYLILPAGYVMEGFPKARWAAVSLAVLGFVIQVPSVLVNIARYDYHLKVEYKEASGTLLLFSPAHTPILGQPKEVAIVFKDMRDKALMDQRVSQALAKRVFSGAGYEDVLNNALAINAPNFWWYYMHLFGFPFYMAFAPPMLLFLLVLIWGRKIYVLNRDEG